MMMKLVVVSLVLVLCHWPASSSPTGGGGDLTSLHHHDIAPGAVAPDDFAGDRHTRQAG